MRKRNEVLYKIRSRWHPKSQKRDQRPPHHTKVGTRVGTFHLRVPRRKESLSSSSLGSKRAKVKETFSIFHTCYFLDISSFIWRVCSSYLGFPSKQEVNPYHRNHRICPSSCQDWTRSWSNPNYEVPRSPQSPTNIIQDVLGGLASYCLGRGGRTTNVGVDDETQSD